jgi:hypothetical protein
MTIPTTTYPIEGDYNILWSSTAKFEEGKTTIIKSGTAPRGTTTVVDSFAIPEASFGVHYVGFVRLGHEDQPTILSFNVQPHLKVQPVSVPPDTTVTIYGTGFSTGDTGSITFDGKSTDVKITTNEVGSFIIDFMIPNISAAQHQISATLSKLSTSVAPATLLVVPEITIDTQLPKAGAKVNFTGRGFAANSSISIQCNDLILTSSPSTDNTGYFTYSLTLPQSYQNGYRFVATDQSGNTATLNSTGGNTPPPSTPPPSTPQTPQEPAPVNGRISKPTAIEPKGQRFGLFGAQTVNFVWNQVSASGGVSYTLEVADNYKFSEVKPGMRASGLTQTNYTLELDPGTYYWRVKAVDGSGNESEWANSLYTFNVGLFPGWVLPIAGVVYLVIFILLIRALLRRRNRYYPYY